MPRSASRVAQVGNLLYRRLAVGGADTANHNVKWPARPGQSLPSGLPIRDTADYQSALP
jgi:hypothetical protein